MRPSTALAAAVAALLKVDLCILAPHAADKITVAGGNTAFSSCQDSCVGAQAKPAGRSHDHRPGLCQYIQDSFLKSHTVHFPGCRRHKQAHALTYFFVL